MARYAVCQDTCVGQLTICLPESVKIVIRFGCVWDDDDDKEEEEEENNDNYSDDHYNCYFA